VARPARVIVAVFAGVVGAYIGFWIANLAGWSGNARWPLDPRGGAGTLLPVIALAAAAALATGAALGLIPTVTYRKVATEGIQTTAAIVDVWRTGAITHDMGEVLSEYGLVLEVRPPAGTPYRTRTKTMVTTGAAGSYLPGSKVMVRYHPTTPRKVFVVGPIRQTSDND
jgi:hypothetical protein